MDGDVRSRLARGFRIERAVGRSRVLESDELASAVRYVGNAGALIEVPFTLRQGDSANPFTLLYAARGGARPALGYQVRGIADDGAVTRRPTSHTVISTLCSILSRMTAFDTLPSEAFAEVALALRAAHAPQSFADLRERRGLSHAQNATALRMLGEQLLSGFSLCGIAEACGMSERDLSRAFRQTHGMTVHRWRKWQRIELAKRILVDTNNSIGAVGLACGFPGHEQFIRAFASFEGMPPLAWRRSAPESEGNNHAGLQNPAMKHAS